MHHINRVINTYFLAPIYKFFECVTNKIKQFFLKGMKFFKVNNNMQRIYKTNTTKISNSQR